MKFLNYKILLVLILTLGIFLRFYKLGEIPGSLNWDEVSWGYNAYSILLTGRDEHGSSFPLSFKAFGDYKQPVYVYLSVVPIKFLGLTPEAVRFPSAALGSLSVFLVFLFTRELFRKEENVIKIALVSSFLFAISPWSIQFSRVAYEANAGLFFVLLGVFLFLRGINTKNNKILFLSAVFLGIAGFTYHSLKIFTPIMVIFLSFYSLKFFDIKKSIIAIFFLIYVLFSLLWVLDMRTTARGRSVTFVSNSQKILEKPIQEMSYDSESRDKLGALIHNRRLVYLRKYTENYLAHFNPVYLFVTGDNPRHHAPGMGLLYIICLPFILTGIYFAVKRKPIPSLILFVWMLLAPVASALAIEAPNASRSLIFLPTWQIFSALGWVFIYERLRNKKNIVFTIVKIILPIFLLLNFSYYLHQYFVHTNTDTLPDWQYGYKEAIDFTNKTIDKNIFFAENIEQGYIFYLFHAKYDPEKYIRSGGSDRIFMKCFNIGNSYFGSCDGEIKQGDLFVTSESLNQDKYLEIKNIKYPNGNDSALKIYQIE